MCKFLTIFLLIFREAVDYALDAIVMFDYEPQRLFRLEANWPAAKKYLDAERLHIPDHLQTV